MYKAEGRTGQEAMELNCGGEIEVRPKEKLFKDMKEWNRLPGTAETLQGGKCRSGAVSGATGQSRASLGHQVRWDGLGTAALPTRCSVT